MKRVVVYILINEEEPHKSCIHGVYAVREYAEFIARTDLLGKVTRIHEETVAVPSAGFVTVPGARIRKA